MDFALVCTVCCRDRPLVSIGTSRRLCEILCDKAASPCTAAVSEVAVDYVKMPSVMP